MLADHIKQQLERVMGGMSCVETGRQAGRQADRKCTTSLPKPTTVARGGAH